MILIHNFHEVVKPYLTQAHCHNQVFLHYLFPESIPFPHTKAGRILKDEGSYQKVAILGYQLALGQNCLTAFEFACTQLMGRDLSKSFLGTDSVALLGIALGMRRSENQNENFDERWKTKLMNAISQQAEMLHFIRGVLNGYRRIDPGHEVPEYSYFLTIQSGERPPDWATQLKAYFVEHRKQPYLEKEEDFLLANLRLYILDACFRECIWEVKQVKSIRADAVAQIDLNLQKLAQQRGNRRAVFGYSLGTVLLAALSIYLFSDKGTEQFWDMLSVRLMLAGGPISLLAALFKVFKSLRGKPLWWSEFSLMKEHFSQNIYRRLSEKLGLPARASPV